MVGLPGALLQPNFKPSWREPSAAKKIKEWPPRGYIKEVEVDDGNFWKLGRTHGRENPWDIIIFNFQTEDPMEVNWYLHHAVGCWKSKDGANFSFDGSITNEMKPGKVYIPSPSWRPDPKFEKGSGKGAFVDAIHEAAVSILKRLAARMPTIQHNNSRMSGFGFDKVAELISGREITVRIDPTDAESARYDYGDKVITLGKVPSLRSTLMHAVLANEATHAFTHWRNVQVNAYTNELISSLTEAVAAATVSEAWLTRQMARTHLGYDQLYFPGWVWLNHLGAPMTLGQFNLNRDFPHPTHGDMRNPFRELMRYHDAIPEYHFKRRIVWDHDWD